MKKTLRSLDSKSHLLDQLKKNTPSSMLSKITTQSGCFLSLSHYHCYHLTHLESSLSLPQHWHPLWISMIHTGDKKKILDTIEKKISPPYTTSAAKTQLAICISPCCFHCCKIPGYVLRSFAPNSTTKQGPDSQ